MISIFAYLIMIIFLLVFSTKLSGANKEIESLKAKLKQFEHTLNDLITKNHPLTAEEKLSAVAVQPVPEKSTESVEIDITLDFNTLDLNHSTSINDPLQADCPEVKMHHQEIKQIDTPPPDTSAVTDIITGDISTEPLNKDTDESEPAFINNLTTPEHTQAPPDDAEMTPPLVYQNELQAYATGYEKVTSETQTPSAQSVSDESPSVMIRMVRWFFHENPLVKIGIVILFIGLSFLLKIGMEIGLFPIEMRLLLAAAIGVILFGAGWKMRFSKPDYGLSLQGAGLGSIYFILYAATKIFAVFAYPQSAFLGMILICVFIIYLSLIQRAQVLGFIALLGGFMAPILMSSGGGSFLQLYGYFTILSVAIYLISRKLYWPYLHLLGFIMVFCISSFLGFSKEIFNYSIHLFDPKDGIAIATLILINIIIYGLALVINSRDHFHMQESHDIPQLSYRFNTSLLIGVPILGYIFIYQSLQHFTYGPAIGSLIIAFLYSIAHFILRRKDQVRYAGEIFFFTGFSIGFITLCIPLTYSANVTAIVWAIEGAMLLLLNHREIPRTTFFFGSLLILASMCRCFYLLTIGMPISMSVLLINSLCLLIASWRWKNSLEHDFSGFLNIFIPIRHTISLIFLLLSYILSLFYLFELATRLEAYEINTTIWPHTCFIFLTLLGLGQLVWMSLRHLAHWPEIILAERFNWFIGLSFMLFCSGYLITQPDFLSTYAFGFHWSLVLASFSTLVNTDKYFKHNRTGLVVSPWIIWLINALLITIIPFHILTAIQGMTLLYFYQRKNLHHSILFLGITYALAAIIFAIFRLGIGHQLISNMSYFVFILISLPLFYGTYILEKSSPVPKSQSISMILILLGTCALFWVSFLWSIYLSGTYFKFILMAIALGIAATAGISAKSFHWRSIQSVYYAFLVNIALAQIIQFLNLLSTPITHAKPGLELIYTLLLFAGITAFYRLIRDHNKIYKYQTGINLHFALPALISFTFFNLYLIICQLFNGLLPNKIVALYIGVLPLMVCSLISRYNNNIHRFVSGYRTSVSILFAFNVIFIIYALFAEPILIHGIFIPLINPVELGLLFNGSLSFLVYSNNYSDRIVQLPQNRHPFYLYTIALMFMLTISLARVFNVYGNIPWIFSELWLSRVFQATVSILWTLAAMFLIIRSQKSQQYAEWLAGAITIGIILIKLFIVDIARGGGLTRALLFVGIALLLIVLGYFAPMPPIRRSQSE